MSPLLGLIFLFGFVGGYIFFWLGAPMPFMLGGILGSACFVVVYEQNGKQVKGFTMGATDFIAIIGTMIGSRFSPELLALLLILIRSGDYSVHPDRTCWQLYADAQSGRLQTNRCLF